MLSRELTVMQWQRVWGVKQKRGQRRKGPACLARSCVRSKRKLAKTWEWECQRLTRQTPAPTWSGSSGQFSLSALREPMTLLRWLNPSVTKKQARGKKRGLIYDWTSTILVPCVGISSRDQRCLLGYYIATKRMFPTWCTCNTRTTSTWCKLGILLCLATRRSWTILISNSNPNTVCTGEK